MPTPTLIAEATRRSGVLWLYSPDVAPVLVWHLWHDGAAYLVCGGDEQALPPLGPTLTVAVRSKAGALIVQWTATVEPVLPGSAQWQDVVPLLAAGRLNAREAEDLPRRWAESATVLRLSPQLNPGTEGRSRQGTT